VSSISNRKQKVYRKMVDAKESLAAEISSWMAQRVQEAGAAGIVLGLSGGIDSAVVAGLAAQALPGHTLGVLMPCHSQPQDALLAQQVVDTFQIESLTVDLSAPFDAMLSQLPQGSDLAQANLKPRLRMMTLYYLANARNYLVAGTGNRTELMVGYFTKYGDGGVDLLPIGSLYKWQVRELARELGVPQPIIDRPPSAGLWAGQTDEDEIGISYADLDAILEALARGERPQQDKQLVDKVKHMVTISEHKRNLAPIFGAAD
jgi:NAD+ synthase